MPQLLVPLTTVQTIDTEFFLKKKSVSTKSINTKYVNIVNLKLQPRKLGYTDRKNIGKRLKTENYHT